MDEKREAEAIAMGTRLKGMELTDYEVGVLRGLTVNKELLEDLERKQKEENRQRA